MLSTQDPLRGPRAHACVWWWVDVGVGMGMFPSSTSTAVLGLRKILPYSSFAACGTGYCCARLRLLLRPSCFFRALGRGQIVGMNSRETLVVTRPLPDPIAEDNVTRRLLSSFSPRRAFLCRALLRLRPILRRRVVGRMQLLVWEWQSETYVLKQQGHGYGLNCAAFGATGSVCATGGDDSKVWAFAAWVMIVMMMLLAKLYALVFRGIFFSA